MSTEVFVSYSNQDYERVMPLVERLRNAGVSVWVDEGSIDAATLWSESIVEAISECRVLIMMVSSHSTDSHNVVKEVMIASEGKKTILPIYLEPAEIPAKLKYQLTGIQHLEWFDGGNDEVFETLKDGLAKRGVIVDGKSSTTQVLSQVPKKTTRKPHLPPNRTNQSTTRTKNIALAALALACVLLLTLNFLNTKSQEKREPTRNRSFCQSTLREVKNFTSILAVNIDRILPFHPMASGSPIYPAQRPIVVIPFGFIPPRTTHGQNSLPLNPCEVYMIRFSLTTINGSPYSMTEN